MRPDMRPDREYSWITAEDLLHAAEYEADAGNVTRARQLARTARVIAETIEAQVSLRASQLVAQARKLESADSTCFVG